MGGDWTREDWERNLGSRLGAATFPSPVRPAASAAALSPRESDVLALLASGQTNRQIAAGLTLSEATVATHVRHILQKTGSANRAEATAYAIRNGLA